MQPSQQFINKETLLVNSFQSADGRSGIMSAIPILEKIMIRLAVGGVTELSLMK